MATLESFLKKLERLTRSDVIEVKTLEEHDALLESRLESTPWLDDFVHDLYDPEVYSLVPKSYPVRVRFLTKRGDARFVLYVDDDVVTFNPFMLQDDRRETYDLRDEIKYAIATRGLVPRVSTKYDETVVPELLPKLETSGYDDVVKAITLSKDIPDDLRRRTFEHKGPETLDFFMFALLRRYKKVHKRVQHITEKRNVLYLAARKLVELYVRDPTNPTREVIPIVSNLGKMI